MRVDDDLRPLYTCPKCGSRGRFRPAEVEDNNSGCLIFLLGGLLPYLLFQSSQKDLVICDRCHYVFKAPVSMDPKAALFIALVCFALVVAVLIFWLVGSR